ncbi:Uncharacterised protein [Vibrio cholerae]|nr:Uncharacterised protein [Vibrio cholerae]
MKQSEGKHRGGKAVEQLPRCIRCLKLARPVNVTDAAKRWLNPKPK